MGQPSVRRTAPFLAPGLTSRACTGVLPDTCALPMDPKPSIPCSSRFPHTPLLSHATAELHTPSLCTFYAAQLCLFTPPPSPVPCSVGRRAGGSTIDAVAHLQWDLTDLFMPTRKRQEALQFLTMDCDVQVWRFHHARQAVSPHASVLVNSISAHAHACWNEVGCLWCALSVILPANWMLLIV